MERIRRHVSYANVAATLALVFAMSGVGYAASGGFTSGGKLQACVNEEGTLKLLKAGKHCAKGQKPVAWNQTGPPGANGAPGVTGIAGPVGATGAVGAVGAKGAEGAKGSEGSKGENAFTNIVIRKDVIPNVTEGDDLVKCHAGEVAIGGGATSNNLQSRLSRSVPFDLENGVESAEGSTPTEWLSAITNPTSITTTFYAVCASR
jgi:hypothetical protein